MNRKVKLTLLIAGTVVAAMIVFSLPHIPQSAAYHHFCDERRLWGIANFANVASNLVFLYAGIAGFRSLRISAAEKPLRIIYSFVFTGILLTAPGSAIYHYAPASDTLVFDRLPITIVFMGLLAAVIAEGIGPRVGLIWLAPLLLTGIGSVLWWHVTESRGAGDLRLYVLVQYYPILLIPAILLLFPSPAIRSGWPYLLWAFAWYGIAKAVESADCQIYSALRLISGHTLKHLTAGISTYLLVKRFQVTYPG